MDTPRQEVDVSATGIPHAAHGSARKAGTPVPGAQAIARAAHLLRLVTAAGDTGASVADLAHDADLTRPTAHRLLSALRVEGLVDRDDATGHWLRGPSST